MNIQRLEPARAFRVGRNGGITIRHAANIALEDDEQVTFVTPSGTEHDVVRKAWGYYATSSLNSRLPEHGLRPAIARGRRTGRIYLFLVETGRERDFDAYATSDGLDVICWLDVAETIVQLVETFRPK